MATVHPEELTAARDTMTAAYVTEWLAIGTVADNISFGQISAPPAPKKGEVLIGIKAASITVDDVPLLQDTAAGGWFFHTRKPSVAKPLVGGQDFAGVVLACGPSYERKPGERAALNVGDRVVGIAKVAEYQGGTWAEQMVLPEKDVCLVSTPTDALSDVDAAGVAMGTMVCSDMMRRAGLFGKQPGAPAVSSGGARVLVLGASGALASVLLDMLKKCCTGIHATAVCSGAHVERLKKLGGGGLTLDVVDYTKGPLGAQLADAEKFGVVFDFVGGSEMQRGAAPLLVRGGIFVTAVGDRQYMASDRKLSCGEFCGSACTLLGRSMCGPGGGYRYAMSQAYPPLKDADWTSWVGERGVRAAIAEEVPFAEAPLREALRKASSHHAGGRVVLNVMRRS